MHPRSEREHFDREVAVSQDGKPVTEHPTRPRKAYVAELTGLLDLSGGGGPGARLLVRRERAHPGAQLSLIDTDGWRHQAFLTDQPDHDLAELDRLHRAHAHVEARIEDSHALGLAKLPFRSFQMNEAWMQLVLCAQQHRADAKALTLTGDLARAKTTHTSLPPPAPSRTARPLRPPNQTPSRPPLALGTTPRRRLRPPRRPTNPRRVTPLAPERKAWQRRPFLPAPITSVSRKPARNGGQIASTGHTSQHSKANTPHTPTAPIRVTQDGLLQDLG